jgi:hypothetical protein
VPASGSPPTRLVRLDVTAPYVPGSIPRGEQVPPPVPQAEATLDAMQVRSGRCTP